MTLFIEIFRGSRPRSGHFETIRQLIRFDSIIYCSIYNVQTFKIMSLMRHNIINQRRFDKPNEQNLCQQHCNGKFISNGHFVRLFFFFVFPFQTFYYVRSLVGWENTHHPPRCRWKGINKWPYPMVGPLFHYLNLRQSSKDPLSSHVLVFLI